MNIVYEGYWWTGIEDRDLHVNEKYENLKISVAFIRKYSISYFYWEVFSRFTIKVYFGFIFNINITNLIVKSEKQIELDINIDFWNSFKWRPRILIIIIIIIIIKVR